MLYGIILLKRPYISLNIATRGSKCENNLYKVKAWDYFPIADFYLWPFFNVKWDYLPTKALYLL